MKQEKRVVDLIYVAPPKSAEELLKDYHQKIDIWASKLKELQEQYFSDSVDSASEAVQEVMSMRRFLGKFLSHRMEWISTKVTDPTLSRRYLQVLPPFHQKGGIKSLLFHFYQLKDTEDKKGVLFESATPEEREVRVLWDIYKLRKTIESILVLEKELEAPDAFPSIFTLETRKKRLGELKNVFKLMFKMCIQPAHQKALYRSLGPEHITAEAIVKRSESGVSLVYPHVLKKLDYRNHFFFIYFFSGMKAKVAGEMREFRFNYLDFEIIKQEFLTNWLTKKLQGNPQKNAIYEQYKIGDSTLAELIAKDPGREVEILQQLPYELFNDLTSKVNEEVDEELKTKVETFSDSFGDFAEVKSKFEQALEVAKLTIDKIKEKFLSPEPSAPPEVKAPEPEPEPEPEPKPEEAPKEISFKVIPVKKNEIDFPFNVKSNADFSKRLNILRAKMGNQAYGELNKKLSKLFSNTSESAMIQRRTPKHEWVMPYLVKEFLGDDVVQEHLVVLGAEVKAKGLGMGYSASSGQNAYQFTCFFNYATAQPEPSFGAPIEQRSVRGQPFSEYTNVEPLVREKALMLIELILNPK